MSGFVVDCSVTVPWYLEGERNDYSDRILASLEERQPWVPALWRSEFCNALLTATRRRRITGDWLMESLDHAERLPLRIDDAPAPLSRIAALAAETGLTAYDATYLELAMRRKIPLATQDRALRRAAAVKRVKLA